MIKKGGENGDNYCWYAELQEGFKLHGVSLNALISFNWKMKEFFAGRWLTYKALISHMSLEGFIIRPYNDTYLID